MKKDLKELIEELDPPTFEKYVEDFLSNYKDEDSFLNYFKTTYLNRKEKWAYCYRLNLGVNVNMKLERWHRSLKHEEGNGTVMKRLDKTLNLVLKACTKKLIGRLTTLERGKLTKRVQLIRKRHSIEMDEDVYSIYQMEDKFIITKSDGQFMNSYDVKINDKTCHCAIKCIDCNVCEHTCPCTCVDSNIRFLICKHIHFVSKKFGISRGEKNNASMCAEDNALIIDVTEDEVSQYEEKDIIIKQLHKKPRLDIDQDKSEIEDLMQSISRAIQKTDSPEDVAYVKDHLKNINAYLNSTNKPSKLQIAKTSNNIASNKKN